VLLRRQTAKAIAKDFFRRFDEADDPDHHRGGETEEEDRD
jgi:hypothetical protein